MQEIIIAIYDRRNELAEQECGQRLLHAAKQYFRRWRETFTEDQKATLGDWS